MDFGMLGNLSKVIKHSSNSDLFDSKDQASNMSNCFSWNKNKRGSLSLFKTTNQNKGKKQNTQIVFSYYVLKPLYVFPPSAELTLSLA